MTDAEIDALAAKEAPAAALTDADMDRLSQGQAAPPAAQASAAPPEEPGFFRRAYETVKHGAGSVVDVTKTLAHQAGQRAARAVGLEVDEPEPTPEQGAAQVRELTRGVDNILTLGRGQRIAARIGNALGDTPENSLDETRHFSTSPVSGDIGGPSQRQARDAELAPNFQTAGSTLAVLAPVPNPLGELGGVAGKAIGATAERFAPAATAVVQKAAAPVQRVATAIRGVPVVGDAAHAVAGYEANAPIQAALTPDIDGHRLEAAKQAAVDPGGVMSSLILGGVLGPARRGIMNSEGGQKRAYIEQHGEGAKVGPFTAGKGGVYANQLHGLPENDAGIGQAELKGARGIMGDIEQRHETQHGYPYRGGPELVKDAEQAARDANQKSMLDVTLAKEQRRADVKSAKGEVLRETSKRANKTVAELEAERRQNVSEPYRVVKEQIDASPASREMVDASDLVPVVKSAARDLGTDDLAKAKLQGWLSDLESRRDFASGKVLINHRELTDFRGKLMRAAKVGQSDVRGKAETSLREAAFAVKELVDQGPYADLNRVFAEGASEVEGKRQAVGLKKKSQRDRAAEVEGLTKRYRKGVNDETQTGTDLSDLRRRLDEAERSAQPAIEEARMRNAAAREQVKGTKAKVAAGDEAAIADRKMLGLPSKIGTDTTDLNQLALRLGNRSKDSESAGRYQGDLDAYRAAHPDQETNTRLADLMKNRLDLKYSLGDAQHGTIIHRLKPMGIYRALKANVEPLTARVAYGPAKKLDPVAIAQALGRLRGATLGEKIKQAIEHDKELRQ